MKRIFEPLIAVIIITLICAGCRERLQPRPRGYFRIDLPEKEYLVYDTACPFIFEYPNYGELTESDDPEAEPCWFNIEFKNYRAKIHISYKAVAGNLPSLLEDTYTLAYNHTIKADAIRETPFVNEEENVYGLLYDIRGNTATAVQFYLTDSASHFLRGSLYFFASPNEDSLSPVISFFREDIIHLIETTRWNESYKTASR
ncbi:MAG: gliding motility lipoprotein GldD [Bacteroidales bacterium]